MPDPAEVSVDDERAALARAQAGLLAALVAGGEVPPGFDAERLRIQTAGLVAKRRRAAARHGHDPVTPEPRVRSGRWLRRWFRFRGGDAPWG